MSITSKCIVPIFTRLCYSLSVVAGTRMFLNGNSRAIHRPIVHWLQTPGVAVLSLSVSDIKEEQRTAIYGGEFGRSVPEVRQSSGNWEYIVF